ncbi:hypothetical protein ACOJBM_06435 [Rhizobium beringeri]
MRKEIWFFHTLGPIEIAAAAIAISGITTIGGIWVTTAAKSVYVHPMDNLPLHYCRVGALSAVQRIAHRALLVRRQYAS